MSNSHLAQARRTIARASAPEGGGKDPNLVLYVVDGVSGSCDPAFDAHVLPVTRYATAWWEGWQPSATIASAYEHARARIFKKNLAWGCVNGPLAALIVSLERMRWLFVSPSMLSDGLGNIFNLVSDPPCIVAAAMKASVRRWRIAMIFEKYPACRPMTMLIPAWMSNGFFEMV